MGLFLSLFLGSIQSVGEQRPWQTKLNPRPRVSRKKKKKTQGHRIKHEEARVSSYRRSGWWCYRACRNWHRGQRRCPEGRLRTRRSRGRGWRCPLCRGSTRTCRRLLLGGKREREGWGCNKIWININWAFCLSERRKRKMLGCSWPSMWMFFRKTGFTTLVPIRTPPVLQYRMLLPDFRFT